MSLYYALLNKHLQDKKFVEFVDRAIAVEDER